MRALGISIVVAAVVACGTSSAPPPTNDLLPSLDSVCDGNPAVTGRALIASVDPSYTATFDNQMTGKKSPLMLGFEYTMGEIHCRPHTDPCKGCQAAPSPAFVTLTANIRFKTGDGAFDEYFAARISQNDSGQTIFDATLPADSLMGTVKAQGGVRISGTLLRGSTKGFVALSSTTGTWQ